MRTDLPSIAARPRESRVTIVSDERPEHLARLCGALEQHQIGYAVRSATASAPVRAGVAYVRRIDHRLSDESAFVRVAALAAKPAFTVNTPGSVRIAEWSPLTVHALRDHRVPQPGRLWCLDESDLLRAVEALGLPLVMEGVVTRRRVLATTTRELDKAFAEAAGHQRDRGALVESPVRARTAELTAMVVDGTSILLPGRHTRHISEHARARVASVAAQAVAAIGGAAMAVDLVVDAEDVAYVTRIDAAPRIARLNDQAISALVQAVSRRLREPRPVLRARPPAGSAVAAAPRAGPAWVAHGC